MAGRLRSVGDKSNEPRLIEVAHGLTNRNTFISLDDLEEWRREQGDDFELYSSYFRFFTDDPNIGGVLGGFGMDFDDEQNPEKARKEALIVIKDLINRYEIDENSISTCFSGNKGFHVFINRRVFGVEPEYHLPRIFKSMAQELRDRHQLKTLDLKIYDRRRLIRLPGSRHRKSGLYKIPLMKEELEKLSVDRIKSLAVKPRPLIVRNEHKLSERAHQWYLQHREKVMAELKDKKIEFEERDFGGEILPCVKRRLEAGAKEGERNRCAWQLASYLMRRGMRKEEVSGILEEWRKRCELGLHPFTAEELKRTIDKVFEVGGYGVGCGSEAFESLCVGRENCPLFNKTGGEENYNEFKEEAEYILKEGNPLEFIKTVVQLEHAGDDLLIKAEYISALSATLAPSISETINLWSIGQSGKGKTHSMQAVLKVLPSYLYEIFTSTSAKAYFYYVKKHGENALSDKLLFIDETEANMDSEPVLRALTNRTEITPRHLSVYDAELLDLKIKGKRAIWFTSVRMFGTDQLHNRFLFLNPDEESEQDIRVYELQRENQLDIEVDDTPYSIAKCMTDIIVKEAKNLPVFIPFVITWPFKQHRYLYPIFISFIKIIAKINFKKRRVEDGYLIADVEDFEEAKRIWRGFIETIAYRVSASAEEILNYIPVERDGAVTHAELSMKSGRSTQWISRICQELLDANLVNREKRSKEGRGRSEWEYWRVRKSSAEDIKVEGVVTLNEFRKGVEDRRAKWKSFLANFETFETFESGVEPENSKPLSSVTPHSWFQKFQNSGGDVSNAPVDGVKFDVLKPLIPGGPQAATFLKGVILEILGVEESLGDLRLKELVEERVGRRVEELYTVLRDMHQRGLIHFTGGTVSLPKPDSSREG